MPSGQPSKPHSKTLLLGGLILLVLVGLNLFFPVATKSNSCRKDQRFSILLGQYRQYNARILEAPTAVGTTCEGGVRKLHIL